MVNESVTKKKIKLEKFSPPIKHSVIISLDDGDDELTQDDWMTIDTLLHNLIRSHKQQTTTFLQFFRSNASYRCLWFLNLVMSCLILIFLEHGAMSDNTNNRLIFLHVIDNFYYSIFNPWI